MTENQKKLLNRFFEFYHEHKKINNDDYDSYKNAINNFRLYCLYSVKNNIQDTKRMKQLILDWDVVEQYIDSEVLTVE